MNYNYMNGFNGLNPKDLCFYNAYSPTPCGRKMFSNHICTNHAQLFFNIRKISKKAIDIYNKEKYIDYTACCRNNFRMPNAFLPLPFTLIKNENYDPAKPIYSNMDNINYNQIETPNTEYIICSSVNNINTCEEFFGNKYIASEYINTNLSPNRYYMYANGNPRPIENICTRIINDPSFYTRHLSRVYSGILNTNIISFSGNILPQPLKEIFENIEISRINTNMINNDTFGLEANINNNIMNVITPNIIFNFDKGCVEFMSNIYVLPKNYDETYEFTPLIVAGKEDIKGFSGRFFQTQVESNLITNIPLNC